MASPTGKRNGASGTLRAQPEDFHDMRNFSVTKPLGRLFQFFALAEIDPFGGSTLSAGQMMVVTMTVAQTIYLRAVLSYPAFDDTSPFELFETTVGGHEITRISWQRRKSFLGRGGRLGIRQDFQNRLPLLGQAQTLFPKLGNCHINRSTH